MTMGSLTNFPFGVSSFGIPVLGSAVGLPFTGNYWFVDPVNGLDGNAGNSPQQALKTLYRAILLATAGNNDVVFLMSNGSSTGSARLSLALAQSVVPTATTGVLNWNKNAVHLVGVGAPAAISQRARIAPPTGTYTQTTFASGNFVNVTGQGCMFANISIFHGFSTGGTNQICWTENGGRNAYLNVDFEGMGDTTSATDAGSRSLLVTGNVGENAFVRCNIGLDTVQRSGANASLELAGGTPRNLFSECSFPFWTSASTPLGILATGASAIDRWQQFKGCQFINAIKSGSTAMSVLASMTSASPGGLLDFDPNCSIIGITKWGDTNALANSYVSQPVPTAATSGIAVNPS
jgi:hypothetical protein